MNNLPKKGKTILIIVVVAFLLYKMADLFSPGSYSHAEHYEISADEILVARAIDKFKLKYPEYCPGKKTENKKDYLKSGY